MSATTLSRHRATVLTLPPLPPPATVQGALALDLTPRVEVPDPPLRRVRTTDLVVAPDTERPRLDAFVGRFLAAATEIAMGDRPVSQAVRHCTGKVYDDLTQRAVAAAGAAGTTTSRGRGPRATRPTLLSVRTSLVRRDALEASAHIRHGARSRALAARFELVDGRWQCVVLEWGA
jgi:hypothetical protein